MASSGKGVDVRGEVVNLLLELRQQVLDAIYAGQPFRTTVRDLGLTPNQVWGLTKSDEGWSTALEAALTASRRVDLQHGTNAAMSAGACAASAVNTSESGCLRIATAERHLIVLRRHVNGPSGACLHIPFTPRRRPE
jgi:hypothetical protein